MRKSFFCLLLLACMACVVYSGFRRERVLLDVCNHVAVDSAEHIYKVYPATPVDTVLAWIERDYRTVSPSSWHLHCRYLGLDSVVPGYYVFRAMEGDRTIIRRLMMGRQSEYKLTLSHSVRTNEHLAARLGKALLLDSTEIISRLQDRDYLSRFGFQPHTATAMFLPNTYFVYWTITPDELFERMSAEYQHFWNESRCAKAQALGLSPMEVMTLASIVNSETFRASEWPSIASLYLNRLRIGMPLQADPTIVFANRIFSARRVLRRHLQVDSPYNTYRHRGLPPGPVRCALPDCVDSVLAAPRTDYIYMCANPDFSGTHVFTSRYADHLRVAARYQMELNRRRIRR